MKIIDRPRQRQTDNDLHTIKEGNERREKFPMCSRTLTGSTSPYRQTKEQTSKHRNQTKPVNRQTG